MRQLLLAIINLSPWIIAIVYDILLYTCRSVWFEVPRYGGRAQGAARPRAPSVRDRSRRMSFADLMRVSSFSGAEDNVDQLRQRHRQHRRDISAVSIQEEDYTALS